jgi:hypothetical protein
MKRLVFAGLFPVFALLILVAPVASGLQWCPKDPIVSLNGQAVQIWVAIPEGYQPVVTGAIDVVVASPAGVEREVLFTDEGFNGYGETVEFVDAGTFQGDAMPVSVDVNVPYDASQLSDGNLPVRLTIVLPDDSVIEVEDEFGAASASFTIPANQ